MHSWRKAAWKLNEPCFLVSLSKSMLPNDLKARTASGYVLQRIDEDTQVRGLHVVLKPRDFIVRHQNKVSWLEGHVMLELCCGIDASEIQLLHFVNGVIHLAKHN